MVGEEPVMDQLLKLHGEGTISPDLGLGGQRIALFLLMTLS